MDLIVPCLERHYDYLLDNFDIFGLTGDYNLSAKGTAALEAKEQSAMRRTEFLNYTANPIDVQLLGPENRLKLLLETAKSLGVELDEPPTKPPQAQQLVQPPAPPQEAPQTTDSAGNPVQGTDTRTANPSRPRLEVSTTGSPGGANI
jgi:hypothetical protein